MKTMYLAVSEEPRVWYWSPHKSEAAILPEDVAHQFCDGRLPGGGVAYDYHEGKYCKADGKIMAPLPLTKGFAVYRIKDKENEFLEYVPSWETGEIEEYQNMTQMENEIEYLRSKVETLENLQKNKLKKVKVSWETTTSTYIYVDANLTGDELYEYVKNNISEIEKGEVNNFLNYEGNEWLEVTEE